MRTPARLALGTTSLLALLLAAAGPAAADDGNGNGNANGHGQGNANGQAAAAAPTEDTDSNDGGTPNNVVDDDDNAHPSGRDRSVEHGGSGNQGNAQRDPDDDGRGPDRTNGGADRPDGRGGVDRADQDGNNGCGNDDDFEDDNEGWCGRNPRRGGPQAPAAQPADDGAATGEQPCAGNMSPGQSGSCGHDAPAAAAPAAQQQPGCEGDMHAGQSGACEDGPSTGGVSSQGCRSCRSSSTADGDRGESRPSERSANLRSR